MVLTDYNSLVNKMEMHPVTRRVVNLRDLYFQSPEILKYKDLTITLNEYVYSRLIKSLGMDTKFLSNLSKMYSESSAMNLVELIRSTMSSQKNLEFVLVFNYKRQLIDISSSNTASHISMLAFKQLTESILTDRNRSMVSADYSDEMGIINMSIIDHKEHKIMGLPKELTKSGIQLKYSPIEGVRIDQFYQRMVCTNGIVANVSTKTIKLTNTAKAADFYPVLFGGDNFDMESYRSLVVRAEKSKVSLGEYLRVKSAINESSMNVPKHIKDIFSSRVEDSYLNRGIDVEELSDRHKANCPTDIIAWDAINALTDVASHDYGIGIPHNQARMQREAGVLFTKPTLDLEYIIPGCPFSKN